MIMKLNIVKPKTPILWFDTWFIWKANDVFWKKMTRLVLEEKIIILDTGQFSEMLERYSDQSKFTDESKRTLSIYETIAKPYISIDHSSFLGRQTTIAMRAYAEKRDELIINFDDLFDPLIQKLTPILDFYNKMYDDKWGTSRNFKGLSSDISIDWAAIRAKALSEKETLSERHKKELLGMYYAIKNIASGSNSIRNKNLVKYYLKKWKKNTGDNDLNMMLKFFKSSHYQAIPYVEIYAWLISDLITGSRDPRPSDYFDLIMIAMAMPFTNYMIIDNDMRNRIVNSLKLVAPDGHYQCKIIQKNEITEILNNL